MVERQLAEEGNNRQQLGREAFLERVWQWKQLYGGAILEQMKRLGASVDWSREYFTMSEELSVAVREAFVRLHEQGLIYRGAYIVNWCPRCQTAISDLEVVHEEQKGNLWEIRYEVLGGAGQFRHRRDDAAGDDAGRHRRRGASRRRTLSASARQAAAAAAGRPRNSRHHRRLCEPRLRHRRGQGNARPRSERFCYRAAPRPAAINVMDETAHINAEGGVYAGLDRYEARAKIVCRSGSAGLAGRSQGTRQQDRQVRPLAGRRRAAPVDAMVCEDSSRSPTRPSPPSSKATSKIGHPEQYRKTYLEWMRNIHDWCISRQLWWGHRIPAWHCATCKQITVARETPSACAHCGSARDHPGNRCARHLVLVGPAALYRLWLAASTTAATPICDLLSDAAAGHGLRHPLLLGRADDHARLPLHARCADARRIRAHAQETQCPSARCYIHALVRDADRQKMSKTKGNVIDPIEIVEALRDRCGALHARGDGLAGHRHRLQRSPHRGLSRLCQQDLERGPLHLHEYGARAEAGLTVDPAKLLADPVLGPSSPIEARWIVSRAQRDRSGSQ